MTQGPKTQVLDILKYLQDCPEALTIATTVQYDTLLKLKRGDKEVNKEMLFFGVIVLHNNPEIDTEEVSKKAAHLFKFLVKKDILAEGLLSPIMLMELLAIDKRDGKIVSRDGTEACIDSSFPRYVQDYKVPNEFLQYRDILLIYSYPSDRINKLSLERKLPTKDVVNRELGNELGFWEGSLPSFKYEYIDSLTF